MSIRLAIALSLLVLPLLCPAQSRAAERGPSPTVASINLCADQLVLLLAEPGQIKSLSNLSHQPSGSFFFEEARSFPTNEGYSEQILPQQPDLVVAGAYSNIHTVSLLRETGLRVEALPIASNIDQMLENIQVVGQWLGQTERAGNLVQGLKERLDALPESTGRGPVAAVYDPNGYTVGANSLRGQMLELAGWENAATQAGIEDYGQLSLEALVRLSPVAIIESPYSPGTWSRGQALSQHPALRRAGLAPIIIDVPSRMTICAGPWTVDVIEQLLAERLRYEGLQQ